jgi:ketosteroid isomerase-like protein
MNISQTGGTEGLGHGRPWLRPGASPGPSLVPAMDDFVAASWVQAYDAAWLGQDWARLARYLAPDVNFVPHGSKQTLVGRTAVIVHLHEFLKRAEVHEYNATGLHAHATRGIAIVSYRWQLEWTADSRRQAAQGRDLISLRFAKGNWQMICRLQRRP